MNSLIICPNCRRHNLVDDEMSKDHMTVVNPTHHSCVFCTHSTQVRRGRQVLLTLGALGLGLVATACIPIAAYGGPPPQHLDPKPQHQPHQHLKQDQGVKLDQGVHSDAEVVQELGTAHDDQKSFKNQD